MKTKVGVPDFGDPRARFAVAIPGAIVVTVLFLIFGRWQPPAAPHVESAPATVVLERPAPSAPPPPPTPRPTPPPTLPPVPHVTIAPVPQRAAPRAVHRSGGGHVAPVARHPVNPQVVAGGIGGGSGPGTGNGQGAGNGGGSGNSTGGTGSGTVNADEPCGSVDLIPYQAPDRSGSITYEHVQATVTFPDGHQQSADFPYRWAYSDPSSDPWSQMNVNNDNFFTRLQLPPPGTDTSRYDDVIRYVIAHTRSDGTTVLQECPTQR